MTSSQPSQGQMDASLSVFLKNVIHGSFSNGCHCLFLSFLPFLLEILFSPLFIDNSLLTVLHM